MTAAQATPPAVSPQPAPFVFRALWPIVDDTVSYGDLCRQAEAELPALIMRAHARLLRPGRFSIAASNKVPGSGNVTDSVLIYEAPAAATPARDYHRRTA